MCRPGLKAASQLSCGLSHGFVQLIIRCVNSLYGEKKKTELTLLVLENQHENRQVTPPTKVN